MLTTTKLSALFAFVAIRVVSATTLGESIVNDLNLGEFRLCQHPNFAVRCEVFHINDYVNERINTLVRFDFYNWIGSLEANLPENIGITFTQNLPTSFDTLPKAGANLDIKSGKTSIPDLSSTEGGFAVKDILTTFTPFYLYSTLRIFITFYLYLVSFYLCTFYLYLVIYYLNFTYI